MSDYVPVLSSLDAIALVGYTDCILRIHSGVGTHKRKAKYTANVTKERGLNKQYRLQEKPYIVENNNPQAEICPKSLTIR